MSDEELNAELRRAAMRSIEARRVGHEEFERYEISTVYVPSLDEEFRDAMVNMGLCAPNDMLITGYFETAVKVSDDWHILARTKTREDAEKNHEKITNMVKSLRPPGSALAASDVSALGQLCNLLKTESN